MRKYFLIKQTPATYLLFVLLLAPGILLAQFNQKDEAGERHGKWRKYYEGTKKLRYEGNFEHGKEVGEFKFYKRSNSDSPTAIKSYLKNSDTLQVTYFTAKGDTISTGPMIGKLRQGHWQYFHKDTNKIMTSEHYKDDQLHGLRKVYFPNGELTETTTYTNGKREGLSTIYSDRGKKLKEFTFVNDLLAGPVRYYDANGTLTIEGQYKNNKQDGVWKYYKDGKIVEEKLYPLDPNKRRTK